MAQPGRCYFVDSQRPPVPSRLEVAATARFFTEPRIPSAGESMAEHLDAAEPDTGETDEFADYDGDLFRSTLSLAWSRPLNLSSIRGFASLFGGLAFLLSGSIHGSACPHPGNCCCRVGHLGVCVPRG